MWKKLGAITIGQSPAEKEVELFQMKVPDSVEITHVGALDGKSLEEIEQTLRIYPLIVRIDGIDVFIDMEYISPLIQKKVNILEKRGVDANIILCAGTFHSVKGNKPLLKPSEITFSVLKSLFIKKVGVASPIKEQNKANEKKWKEAGFEPIVKSMYPFSESNVEIKEAAKFFNVRKPDVICLDCMGYTIEYKNRMKQFTEIPIVTVKELASSFLSKFYQ